MTAAAAASMSADTYSTCGEIRSVSIEKYNTLFVILHKHSQFTDITTCIKLVIDMLYIIIWFVCLLFTRPLSY